jgi:hypothetical protein
VIGRQRRERNEDGSVLPLTIFYGFLSLVLILLVVSASSLYLERKRLFTLADGAALAGAEAFDLSRVTMTPDGPRATLESADVATAARDYLGTAPVDGFDQLSVERAESPDGKSAVVSLTAYWRPPVLSVLVPDGIRLDVTASARSVFF